MGNTASHRRSGGDGRGWNTLRAWLWSSPKASTVSDPRRVSKDAVALARGCGLGHQAGLTAGTWGVHHELHGPHHAHEHHPPLCLPASG